MVVTLENLVSKLRLRQIDGESNQIQWLIDLKLWLNWLELANWTQLRIDLEMWLIIHINGTKWRTTLNNGKLNRKAENQTIRTTNGPPALSFSFSFSFYGRRLVMLQSALFLSLFPLFLNLNQDDPRSFPFRLSDAHWSFTVHSLCLLYWPWCVNWHLYFQLVHAHVLTVTLYLYLNQVWC